MNNNPEAFINDEFLEIEKRIDLKREILISRIQDINEKKDEKIEEIQEFSEKLMNELSEHEKKILSKKSNWKKLVSYDLEEIQTDFDENDNDIKKDDICSKNINKWKDIYNKALSNISQIEDKIDQLKFEIMLQEKFSFKEYSIKEFKDMFGVITVRDLRVRVFSKSNDSSI